MTWLLDAMAAAAKSATIHRMQQPLPPRGNGPRSRLYRVAFDAGKDFAQSPHCAPMYWDEEGAFRLMLKRLGISPTQHPWLTRFMRESWAEGRSLGLATREEP